MRTCPIHYWFGDDGADCPKCLDEKAKDFAEKLASVEPIEVSDLIIELRQLRSDIVSLRRDVTDLQYKARELSDARLYDATPIV